MKKRQKSVHECILVHPHLEQLKSIFYSFRPAASNNNIFNFILHFLQVGMFQKHESHFDHPKHVVFSKTFICMTILKESTYNIDGGILKMMSIEEKNWEGGYKKVMFLRFF